MSPLRLQVVQLVTQKVNKEVVSELQLHPVFTPGTLLVLSLTSLKEQSTGVLLVARCRQRERYPQTAPPAFGFHGRHNSFHRALIWRAIPLQFGIVVHASTGSHCCISISH